MSGVPQKRNRRDYGRTKKSTNESSYEPQRWTSKTDSIGSSSNNASNNSSNNSSSTIRLETYSVLSPEDKGKDTLLRSPLEISTLSEVTDLEKRSTQCRLDNRNQESFDLAIGAHSLLDKILIKHLSSSDGEKVPDIRTLREKLDLNLSIVCYYINQHPIGMISSERIIFDRETKNNYDLTVRNLRYYIKHIPNIGKYNLGEEVLKKHGSSPTGEIRSLKFDGVEYRSMNSSIVFLNGIHYLVLRCVNYILDHVGRYTIFDPQDHIRTKNFLLRLDIDESEDSSVPKISILSIQEITTTAEYTKFTTKFHGVEDCRLFLYKGELHVTGTTNDTCPNGGQVSLLHLNLKEEEPSPSFDKLIPFVKPYPTRCEKNWIPYVSNDDLVMSYSHDPTRVIKSDGGSSPVGGPSNYSAYTLGTPNLNLSRFRGGSTPVPFELDGILGSLEIIHECIEDNRRYYIHRLLWRNPDMIIRRISEPFTFQHMGIEYCAGLCWLHGKPKNSLLELSEHPKGAMKNGGTLLATVSREDRESYIFFLDSTIVKERLIVQVD